jgi:hypothetical protein
MTKVTYVPPDDGQHHPSSLMWNGVKFTANVPLDLDPVKHSYEVLEVERWNDPVTQRPMSKTVERRKSMAEIARTNQFFVVEGDAPKIKRGRPPLPKTPEEYRAHAVAWIRAIDDHDELNERWNTEEAMRQRCGVGDDDIDYLRPMFDARLFELKQQAA